ncbi:MAG: PEP-CTERM sorting domain-containing protein [Acetobacteraceae bacterium]|nr:PEP-CTERM sorting domain-containing protein [Acetobacteraceae bacterium]
MLNYSGALCGRAGLFGMGVLALSATGALATPIGGQLGTASFYQTNSGRVAVSHFDVGSGVGEYTTIATSSGAVYCIGFAGIGTFFVTGYDPPPVQKYPAGDGDVTPVGSSTTAVPVPEPASMAVFAAGLLGLGTALKKRRRACP